MKPYGGKRNTRDKICNKWLDKGKKPHGSHCKVCNPPDKISVNKSRARREAKKDIKERISPSGGMVDAPHLSMGRPIEKLEGKK